MTDHTPLVFSPAAGIDMPEGRGAYGTVRLRTFMTLRVLAIVGQICAVALVVAVWGVRLPLASVAGVVTVAVLIGLAAFLLYPPNRRLTEIEVAAFSLFDIAQLAALLFLTGGLSNPFAVSLLGPVAIATGMLRLPLALGIAAAAIGAVTALALWSLPLIGADGAPLLMPPLFVLGLWGAICLGIGFVALHNARVGSEREAMSSALAAAQAALERERKLTALGGVVAATAHELGTPLATIRLAATELAEELPDGEWREDAMLIAEQASRCRDLLRTMGRSGRDDAMMRRAPAGEVLREAAEPHAERGAVLIFDVAPEGGGDTVQPEIRRSPEIVHGLRNIVQNAVDFAAREVRLTLRWTDTHLWVSVEDDGTGFPAELLGQLGEPDLRRHGSGRLRRGGRRGMGLGLFIAKTLLERSGGRTRFSNARGSGARVEVRWLRSDLEPGRPPSRDPPFLP